MNNIFKIIILLYFCNFVYCVFHLTDLINDELDSKNEFLNKFKSKFKNHNNSLINCFNKLCIKNQNDICFKSSLLWKYHPPNYCILTDELIKKNTECLKWINHCSHCSDILFGNINDRLLCKIIKKEKTIMIDNNTINDIYSETHYILFEIL